ncbi:hypothetical protein SAMN05660657_03518 [Geodermatophilus amargosae]|uniref:Uncharacterized protein n=1 Tax=Geodermatophilus amargosae TaxID=1296565 RepID=A0A1I7BDH0_9ACTN|nr:hypothetical protein [Geodermatophilus amargosae]SFT85246.1 hypothetical protein SAMN05660657_03518 [Geodermatophilus amargosae]
MRVVRLTSAGMRERREFDERSDGAAAALLARLSPVQQQRLTEAMGEVNRLLTAR